MLIYVAMNSEPDWTSHGPRFKSVHKTLEGAIKSLYPKGADFRQYDKCEWIGPDGFGLIRLVKLED